MSDYIDFDMNENDLGQLFIPKLERSCTGTNCVCKVYGRKPCETYQTCIKCYKDFNICKCYIKKELNDHFEYKKILKSTFKDLVSTKPANRIPRQFREMSIRRQNYYHVLNNYQY
jgi:hypothetical protein